MGKPNQPGWFQRISRKFVLSTTGWWTSGGSSGGEYGSGQTGSRHRSRIPGGMPSDNREELRPQTRQQILKRSRHLSKNSGFPVEMASLMRVYAIGEGMRPQAMTESEDWNNLAEEYAANAARRPEITGRFTMAEVQGMVSQAIDFDGEIFALKTRDKFDVPKIQLLETHRISTITDDKKRLYDGIEYDAVGRPKWYHLIVPEPGRRFSTKTRRIPARSMLHIYDPTRISAARALPPGQAGLLHSQDKLETIALMKHKVKDHAEKSLVLKSDRARALEDGDFAVDSEADEYASQPTDEQAVSDALGGRTLRINADEELKALESESPHAAFFELVKWLETDESGGQLPYEVVRNGKDIGGANIRLVVSKADRKIKCRQQIIETRLMQPWWFYVIGDAIDIRELAPEQNWHRSRCSTTKRITVDAGREAQANREDVILGPKLISEDVSERGGDFDEWLRMRAMEARKIMTAAGIAETEPIPVEMLWNPNPSGSALNENQSP